MWIMCDTGYISIVEHQDDPNVLQVRSRVKDDITNVFGTDVEVYEHVGADYLFRANVSRERVADTLWEKVWGLDYTSHVKDVAIKRSAPAQGRSAAYYATWSAMAKMQPVAPYAGKFSATYSRDDWDFPTPTAGSMASAGMMPKGAPRVLPPLEEEAEALTPEALIHDVESSKMFIDPVCHESHRDARDICDECGHTALVHPGLNETDACIMCELEDALVEVRKEIR